MRYTSRQQTKRRWPRRLLVSVAVVACVLLAATFLVRRVYNRDLRAPGASQTTQLLTINQGTGLAAISTLLQKDGLIRSAWAFRLYVSSKNVRANLQAGTYRLSPSQSVPEIVSVLTHGKIATSLVTILPGQRLSQIRNALITDGFPAATVDAALQPTQYLSAYPKLFADRPSSATLEGYLYPDSFQKTANTKPQTIIGESLAEMQSHLTSDIIASWRKQDLNTFQGMTLASIVEQEVSSQSDRDQVAQIFLSRLKSGMTLGSDVTAYYGALLAGATPSVHYDSPYNTLIHAGLPPGPISNVDASALKATAHPAATAWLYFVTGDNGTTYYSQTLQEHDQQTQQYCHALCQQ